MPEQEFYRHCDDLQNLPPIAARNYDFELIWLTRHLPADRRVLQVGSHDGRRALSLLQARPDLAAAGFTGLELEEGYVSEAQARLHKAGVAASFVCGDITAPPKGLGNFDYVVCLNNTLGYIPSQADALKQMKGMGETIIISVFGESFNEEQADAYFKAIGSEVTAAERGRFILGDFGVQRYRRADIDSWGGKVTETPLGYLAELRGTPPGAQ